jgi:predicted regulator of Ras-like GTPase activity (Roadblock/LC7/MglB family)
MSEEKEDNRLKLQKLNFYENDVQRINQCLSIFLKRCQAKCAMLVDVDGYLITMQGQAAMLQEADMEPLCTLMAGTFSATKAWVQMLGVKEFAELYHQGEVNVVLKLVDPRALIAVIYDEATTLGMVKLMVDQVIKSLRSVFAEADAAPQRDMMQELADKMTGNSGDMFKALDDLFG